MKRMFSILLAAFLLAAGPASPAFCQAKADAKKKAAPAAKVSVSEWRAYFDEADKLLGEGRPLQAEPVARKALEVAEKGFGRNHPNTAESEHLLGVVYLDMGHDDRAEPHLLRALAALEKNAGSDSLGKALVLNNLSVVYYRKGDLEKSESFLRRSIGIREKARGPDHYSLASPVHNLAGIVAKRGDHAAAEALYRRAVSLGERVPGTPKYGLASTLGEFGGFLLKRGRHAEAEEALKRALAVFGKNEKKHPGIVPILRNMGLLHVSRGNLDAAEKCFREALAAARAATGHDSPVTRRAFRDIIDFHREHGLPEEAARYEAWAAEPASAQEGK